jgi:preprotein translocase subunit YajC
MIFLSSALFSAPMFSMASLENSGFKNLLPFIMIFFIFYFLLIRPHVKKQKEHEKTVNSLQKGDKVLALGGIMATIAKIEADYITIEIAQEVKIKIIKSAINNVLDKDK